MNQSFTLDRESFEKFLAAASLVQSLQPPASDKSGESKPPLLQYSLEILRAVDSGTLDLQPALERVSALALQILDAQGAVAWLFTGEQLICRAATGTTLDDDQIRTALRARLQSAGAFGTNSPSTVDLTRTLGNYSGTLGSSLAIALLPGRGMAGALAVFGDPSRTFTERNYANLRQLAGLAQYVLGKWIAAQEQNSPDDAPERDWDTDSIHARHARLPGEHGSTAPFLRDAPRPPLHSQVTEPVTVVQSRTEAPPVETAAISAPALHARTHDLWKQLRQRLEPLRRLPAAALDATDRLLQHGRRMRIPWTVVAQAAPAVVILAVMSFFVGLLTGGRQPVSVGPLNSVAQASAQPIAQNTSAVADKTPVIPASSKSPVAPVATSHLQTTDRETAATIADLSKYEVQSLRRSASSGDDQAALALGTLYELGHFLPQSCSKAAVWITTSAQSGNVAAEYNLGLRYKNGDGVPINLEQSEFWLRKAAAHHSQDAARALADLPVPSKDTSLSKITP